MSPVEREAAEAFVERLPERYRPAVWVPYPEVIRTNNSQRLCGGASACYRYGWGCSVITYNGVNCNVFQHELLHWAFRNTGYVSGAADRPPWNRWALEQSCVVGWDVWHGKDAGTDDG